MFKELLEQTFIQENVNIVKSDHFKDVQVICILFSAYWCLPGQILNSRLLEMYKEVNKVNKKLEIIYVSFDEDKAQFDEDISKMPWISLPFKSIFSQRLIKDMKIITIPNLIAFSNNGLEISKKAREEVISLGKKAFDNWVILLNPSTEST